MHSMKASLIVLVVATSGCGLFCDRNSGGSAVDTTSRVAEDYVRLELHMPAHDANHVDAYFGPEDWKPAQDAAVKPLAEIIAEAKALRAELEVIEGGDEMDALRRKSLDGRLRALATRAELAAGTTRSFDEESQALFDTVAPHYDADHFDGVLAELGELVPGDGELVDRVNGFRDQFAIPSDKLGVVFDAAIGECRRRALEHVDLAEGEGFSLEYVSDKPWSGYNWYQGGSQSLIQINTDLPSRIERAIDLGCHEGYPGHHTFKALLERDLAVGRGWVEFTIDPLYAPQSLIAEGSANYGVDLVFPREERIEFEKEVLFPLAGLDAEQADAYYRIEELVGQLSYAGNEAARSYLDGEWSREQAVEWMRSYGLMNADRAEQRVDFIETYRSYVINYNWGKDLVAQYVEAGDADIDQRWDRFKRMLTMPLAASDMAVTPSTDS